MDVLSVVKAMGELISNPDEHARRSELSRQRATAFSWEDMAHTAFGLIEEVARLQ
jgi:glycosyltransferase involved in cell wall biosynthesis